MCNSRKNCREEGHLQKKKEKKLEMRKQGNTYMWYSHEICGETGYLEQEKREEKLIMSR